MNPQVGFDWARLAAQYVLNLLSSEDIKDLAVRLIEAGRWSYAIDDIYTSRYPISSEVDLHFEAILHDEGVTLPTIDVAVWVLLKAYVGDIARGVLPPREGLHRVMEVYYAGNLYAKPGKYAGESHGISKLVGSYYEYDDIDEASFSGRGDAEELAAMDKVVVSEAGEWLGHHQSTPDAI